jgi:hypothetical protein
VPTAPEIIKRARNAKIVPAAPEVEVEKPKKVKVAAQKNAEKEVDAVPAADMTVILSSFVAQTSIMIKMMESLRPKNKKKKKLAVEISAKKKLAAAVEISAKKKRNNKKQRCEKQARKKERIYAEFLKDSLEDAIESAVESASVSLNGAMQSS